MGVCSSSGSPVTFKEFKSNLINGFLTPIIPKGFNSLKPNTLISKLYKVVCGLYLIFLSNSCPDIPIFLSKI